LNITYKYKRATDKEFAYTRIFLNGEEVGYYMPLYNKDVYKHSNQKEKWYVHINTDEYILIEKAETKEGIISLIVEYFKDEKEFSEIKSWASYVSYDRPLEMD